MSKNVLLIGSDGFLGKNVKITIFLSRLSEFLKFLIEKKIIKKEIINPKFNE